MTLLNDLEFRVWTQYLLSADDFGVMRRSAVTLQADNDHLANRPQKAIDRCLNALVKSTLVYSFEHQGRHYVYQRDWQTFQKIEYPRPSFEPKPPEVELLLCNEKTQELFTKHPGGTFKKSPKISQSVPELSPNVSQKFSESSPNVSQSFPDYARDRARETAKANGLRQEATAHGSDARSSKVIFRGQRLTVFEWMFTDCENTLGPHADAFGLDVWFDGLDRRLVRDGLIPPKRDSGVWLQAELVKEAQQRGLPLKFASAGADPDWKVGAVPSKRPHEIAR